MFSLFILRSADEYLLSSRFVILHTIDPLQHCFGSIFSAMLTHPRLVPRLQHFPAARAHTWRSSMTSRSHDYKDLLTASTAFVYWTVFWSSWLAWSTWFSLVHWFTLTSIVVTAHLEWVNVSFDASIGCVLNPLQRQLAWLACRVSWSQASRSTLALASWTVILQAVFLNAVAACVKDAGA